MPAPLSLPVPDYSAGADLICMGDFADQQITGLAVSPQGRGVREPAPLGHRHRHLGGRSGRWPDSALSGRDVERLAQRRGPSAPRALRLRAEPGLQPRWLPLGAGPRLARHGGAGEGRAQAREDRCGRRRGGRRRGCGGHGRAPRQLPQRRALQPRLALRLRHRFRREGRPRRHRPRGQDRLARAGRAPEHPGGRGRRARDQRKAPAPPGWPQGQIRRRRHRHQPDGETLYWQATTGETLYSLPTAVLQDREGSQSAADSLTKVATTHVADGLWIDGDGRLYVTNPGESSVEMADNPSAPLRTLVRDPERLVWPDTFSQGADGAIWFTTSHIPDMPWFKPDRTTTPSKIWKLRPKSAG